MPALPPRPPPPPCRSRSGQHDSRCPVVRVKPAGLAGFSCGTARAGRDAVARVAGFSCGTAWAWAGHGDAAAHAAGVPVSHRPALSLAGGEAGLGKEEPAEGEVGPPAHGVCPSHPWCRQAAHAATLADPPQMCVLCVRVCACLPGDRPRCISGEAEQGQGSFGELHGDGGGACGGGIEGGPLWGSAWLSWGELADT